jgi:hypothetical protein
MSEFPPEKPQRKNAEGVVPEAVYRFSIELLQAKNGDSAQKALTDLSAWICGKPGSYVYGYGGPVKKVTDEGAPVIKPKIPKRPWGKKMPENAFVFDFEVDKMHSRYGADVMQKVTEFVAGKPQIVIMPTPAQRKRWWQRG